MGKGVVRIYYNQTLIATHVHLIGKGNLVLRQVIILNINAMSATEFSEKYQVKMAQIESTQSNYFFPF